MISCEKNGTTDEEPILDTIPPGEYFPVYPGSWWVYQKGDTLKTADDYQEFTYISDCDDLRNTRSLALPLFLDNNIYGSRYVNRYMLSNPFLDCRYPLPFIPVLSDTLGQVFVKGVPDLYHHLLGKTIAKDTSIKINGVVYEDVIITIEYDRACSESSGYTPVQCATMKEYFARGIGLIKREKGRNIVYTEWETEYEIRDFHINKNESQ